MPVRRHHPIGPALPNERAAIEFLRTHLPSDCELVTNVELRAGGAGRTFEHDAVVVCPYMVFAIELKNYSGLTRGNRDRWYLEGGQVVQSPVPLQSQKARVLAGLLKDHHFSLGEVWVQGVVFLSNRNATRELTAYGDIVFTRADLIAALADRRRWPQGKGITRKQHQEIMKLLLDQGAVPELDQRLGPFQLTEQLPDRGTHYVAWRGTRHGKPRTLHVYEVRGGDPKARARARQVAEREADLHERLRGGPGLIRYYDLDKIAEPQEQIILSFEDTSGLLPLPDWIARHDPSRAARLTVAERVVQALRFVHRKELIHRRLRPDAVLVADEPEPDTVRLYAFERARDLTHQLATVSTRDWEDGQSVTTAPELLRGGDATRRTDGFALGATLYDLLGDQPAYSRPEAVLIGEAPADLRLHGQPWPGYLEECLKLLVDPDPMSRPGLDEVQDALASARRTPAPAPQALRKGDVLCRVYELVDVLGEGASGTTWKVQHRHDGQHRVAKVARDADAAQGLFTEADVLQAVAHPNLARYHSREPHEQTTVVFTAYVHGVDGADWALLADPPTPQQAQGLGEDLFGALGALHAAGWLHRDVKPANVLITEPAGPLTLIDLGLAARAGDRTGLTLGTAAFKDPALYAAGAWAPRDDLFAAWLTLWFLLTNTHAFGGPAVREATPDLDPAHLPDTLPAAARERLVAAVAQALDPDPTQRPADAQAAAAAWAAALAPPQPVQAPQPTQQGTLDLPPAKAIATVELPDDLAADTPIDRLALSVRAHNALRRLGLVQAGQLTRLDIAELRGLPNVGRKTGAELRALLNAVRARLGHGPTPAPGQARPLPAPAPGLYPPLVNDARPIADLGPALTPGLLRGLRDAGVATLGDLASLPEARFLALRGVGTRRLDTVLAALRRLAGEAPPLGSLAALDRQLAGELKQRHKYLAAVYGLADGRAQSPAQAAEALGKTRQAADAALDLPALRAEASVGHRVAQAVAQAIPPVGFAPLPAVAARLATALPASDGCSALGYARLGAGLLDPDHTPPQAPALELAFRPPWTPQAIDELRQALAHAANWPPVEPQACAELLWERAGELGCTGPLRAHGLTDRDLLAAVRPLCPDVRHTPEGWLFQPPVTFRDALLQQQGSPSLRGKLPHLVGVLESIYGGLQGPATTAEAKADLEAAGLTLLDGQVVPIDRPAPAPKATLKVDAQISTRTVPARAKPSAAKGPIDVAELAAAAGTGGFRVVGLPPARHEALADQLVAALTAQLGADRVRAVDVDGVLLDAAHASGLWPDALFEERRPQPDLSWLRELVRDPLRDAITAGAGRGTVTVLTRPTLLGELGLMDWLGRLYEDARGGRFGLLVLALPGTVYDGRVRLNDAWSMAYTPDMAAVVYREAS